MHKLLDPRALKEIRDLRLVARAVVEGFLAGLHRNPRPASGAEFHQFRAYGPGDDLRLVDWRAVARSDRLVVRESRGERDTTVRFFLDATASMAHADGGDVTKLDYGRFLVAALSYLVDLQGDRQRLHALRAGAAIPLGGERRGREFLDGLHALERLEPAGAAPPWDARAWPLARRGRTGRELVVFVGDLYERSGEMRSALRALRGERHEVQVFHLVGRSELDFDFRGDLVFEDLESGATVAGNAERMRRASLGALRAQLEDWRRFALSEGAGYDLVPIDEPLDRALRGFLLRRQRMP
jgi:uncharacterized protein (DUF58 family)